MQVCHALHFNFGTDHCWKRRLKPEAKKTESRLGQGVKEIKAREEKNKQGGGF